MFPSGLCTQFAPGPAACVLGHNRHGVDPGRLGERVWLWEAAWRRADGTAQEYVALPATQAVTLPDQASFDLGASLGIPALTAHRCLTTFEGSTGHLGPEALTGLTVLVAGGAGAVGNAAIQLARWSGATVVTTVSGPRSFLSCERKFCSDVTAVRGGRSPQSWSTSVSVATTRPALMTSSASSARCFVPPSATGP